MNRHFYCFVQVLACSFLLGCIACQRPMYEGDDMDVGSRIPLKVSTRSEGGSQVEYPAYIYVFDAENGNYVDNCTVTDKNDETLDLELIPDEYIVVAVAGIKEGYEIPQKPDLEDVITMNRDYWSEQAMMMGRSRVSVKDGTQPSLNIMLYYAVASVEVNLSDIPATAQEVTFSLSPLYSAIDFGGNYSVGGKEVQVSCIKGDDGLWRSGPFYIYPGSATQTSFSITLKTEESEKTFGYTFNGCPKAKVPLKINGSYKGEITVGGNLTVGGWEETEEVSFEFGPQAEKDNVDNEEEDNNQSGFVGFPEVGDIWKGGMVVAIEEADEGGFNILQMNMNEWTTKVAGAEDLLEEIETDWELPLEDEARFLNAAFGGDNLSKINEKIAVAGDDYPLLQGGDERYLFYNEFKELKGFGFRDKPNIGNPGEEKTYRVRLIRWVHYETE